MRSRSGGDASVALIDAHGVRDPERIGAGTCPGSVLDARTFAAVEGEALFRALDRARTRIGRAAIRRSLTGPALAPAVVRQRQAAVAEIAARPDLREALTDLLTRLARGEDALYELLYAEFVGAMGTVARPGEQVGGIGYRQYVLGTRFLRTLVTLAGRLPRPQSPFLRGLLDDITAFAGTRAYRLARGPVHVTPRGLFSDEDCPRWLPRFRFRPTPVKPLLLAGGGLAIFGAWHYVASSVTTMILGFHPLFLVMAPAVVVYLPAVASFDRESVILPLRGELGACPELHRAMEAVATLDELLAHVAYREALPGDAVLPEIVDRDRHLIELEAARNPVLALEDPDYVANDARHLEERLTAITGPNSGGKTAFCKTLAQCQLLGQIGCWVPARAARMTVADRIAYQVPEPGSLADGEGRFAHELARTREIFFSSTARSLVVLDELSEGTTFEEKMAVSEYVLDGFLRLGATTVLVTHNHQLCDRLAARGDVACRQVEFIDGRPTHRLVEGISRVSHADRVAERIGFSAADIERHPRLGRAG